MTLQSNRQFETYIGESFLLRVALIQLGDSSITSILSIYLRGGLNLRADPNHLAPWSAGLTALDRRFCPQNLFVAAVECNTSARPWLKYNSLTIDTRPICIMQAVQETPNGKVSERLRKTKVSEIE